MADDDSTRRADADDFATRVGLAAGRKVFGRYVLEAVLGLGGMGVVGRARDEELSDLVALKFLPEVVARDAAAVDELREETRNALRLTHPNIVRIRNFEREGSVAAVSMEYVDGTTLSHLRLQRPGKVFSAGELAPLVAQLCAALDYAHREAKVVHRDLKPANILVTKDGAVKITDFGIARSLTETHTRLTGRAGATSGTLVYMSPQQVAGRKATPADDIYALGATLYELLTGKPPFHTGDVTHQILQQPPASLAARRAELEVKGESIPPAWEETIAACLAKDPAQRPQSAGEVAARLGLAGAGGTIAGPSPVAGRGPATSASPTKSRMSRVLFLAGLAVLALGFLVYSFWPKPGFDPSKPYEAIFAPPPAKPVTVFDETKGKAESGDAKAQDALGRMYANGDGVTKDSAEAAKWYRKAADQGFAVAQLCLGRIYSEGNGVPKDSAEAVIWYRKAADQGNPAGQCALGAMYATGDGVSKDSAEALKWYRKAADQGDADGQNGLGFMYLSGEGVPKDSAEAARWYRKAAEQGFAEAQYNLGVMYATGEGVAKDSAEAVKWFRKAAEQGDADGQVRLGAMYATGDGVAKDSAEAVKWIRKAADQGNAHAQFGLGLSYANGIGAPKDREEAAKWYRKAAEQGNAKAQYNLGKLYASGEGVAKDPVEAEKWYRKAADQGDVEAQYTLGEVYLRGDGVLEDSAEAMRWYRKAADQGYAEAQRNLGIMYAKGDGVPKDIAESARWYRKAADQGDAHRQFLLGWMYSLGDGVPKDSAEAVKWYRKAADQGYARAQAMLGVMYESGEGPPKDSTEAVKWYRRAADQGDASGQAKLGGMYQNGDGVPKDEIEALAWYYIAAASGNDLIIKRRDTLELSLGREMSLTAQQRSKEILKEIEMAKARSAGSAAVGAPPP